MFGDNPTPETKEVIDPELAKAQKSMAGRIDPDEPAEEKKDDPAPAADPAPTEKKDEPAVDPDPKPDPQPVTDTKEPVVDPTKTPRPEAYIPLPKYHAEKADWEKKANDAEEGKRLAEAKVAELTALAGQKDGAKKDEDIEEFMDATGFDRETVDKLLNLATKRLSTGQPALSSEQLEAVEKATAIVKEAELETAFNTEFDSMGAPTIKKLFPNATDEQLAKAKEHLDKIAHTAENRDKPLDLLIFRGQEDIAKIFEGDPAAEVQKDKKTIEATRPGGGKPMALTSKDFDSETADFGALADLDAAERSKVIKGFSNTTYQRFLAYAKSQETGGGVEVMRNGRKVVLK